MLLSPFPLALLTAVTILGTMAPALTSPPSPESTPEVRPAPSSAPPWDPSQPVPSGYHVERRTRLGLVIAGSVVFGVAYLGIVVPNLLIATSGNPSAAIVTVPVGRPFYHVVANLRDANGVYAVAGLTAFDALVQAAGAGMLIAGIVGTRVLVPGPARPSAVHLTLVPIRLEGRGAGVGIAGTF